MRSKSEPRLCPVPGAGNSEEGKPGLPQNLGWSHKRLPDSGSKKSVGEKSAVI